MLFIDLSVISELVCLNLAILKHSKIQVLIKTYIIIIDVNFSKEKKYDTCNTLLQIDRYYKVETLNFCFFNNKNDSVIFCYFRSP